MKRFFICYILILVSLSVKAQTFRGGEIFRIGNSDVYWAAWKNRSRLGQCAGADWDTFDAAKLMIFSETIAF